MSEIVNSLQGINEIKKENTFKVIHNYISVIECGEREIDKLLEHTSSKDLIRLLNEALDNYDEYMELDGDNSKINRWLGYVQGVLITVGYLTVQGERDYTRKYFTAHREAIRAGVEENENE